MSFATVLKVLGVSLLVGVVMTVLGVSAKELYEGIGTIFVDVWNWTSALINGEWGMTLLTGASVVVPAWIVVYIVRRRMRSRGG